MRLYCDRLEPIPADILQYVAMQAVDTCQYFPRISELKQPALAIMHRQRAEKLRLPDPEELPKGEQRKKLSDLITQLSEQKRAAA